MQGEWYGDGGADGRASGRDNFLRNLAVDGWSTEDGNRDEFNGWGRVLIGWEESLFDWSRHVTRKILLAEFGGISLVDDHGEEWILLGGRSDDLIG